MNPTTPPPLNPADVQAIATAWIKAATQITLEILTAGFAIWAFVNSMLAKQHSKINEKRIDRQGDTLKNVLRDLPPSVPQSDPIPTTETKGGE